MGDETPALSVVIPAFNEQDYLPRHLPTVLASLRRWETATGQRGEIIVVDNASTDATARVAADLGARVVTEPVRGIGQARNTGAVAASGRYLMFIDADVDFPAEGITDAMRHLASGRCVGGAIPPLYEPAKLGARLLVAAWGLYRRYFGGAQGVTQFCTREAFAALGGYRPDLFMSEDVEFFARLTRLGARRGMPVAHLTHLRVRPSNRRFDRWSSWRMLWWANPVTAHLFLTSRRFWRHWYDSTVR
ncbi:glycosyltransferase [Planomonospora corallina]|uniref:4,4'-diaponeurosporenoate glycosyltransferase n=1 Tax=Planomonospora corallina TaxID=1806052 RepID=A0ABV8ICJ1_9ACTN